MDGNAMERQAYDMIKILHEKRPDLIDKILWSAAKYIACEIVQERRGVFRDVNQPKQKD
jgi:hypothetical protein